MRRYVIVLVLMAIVIGSLFRASEQTGVRLMNMFATIGIFLFGVVGTLALSRWQSGEGLKEVRAALKSLEPDWLITDWAQQGGGRPDYLLVGPGGIVSVSLDETPQSAWAKFARSRVARSRTRAEEAARWLRNRMGAIAATANPEVPVSAVLVLLRRRAEAEFTAGGVVALNAEALADHVRALGQQAVLDEPARIRLTRALRSA